MSLLNKKRTIEEVGSLVVTNGTPNNSVRFTPPAGFLGRVVVHFPPNLQDFNTGFIRCYLKDAAGLDIFKLQSIQSLRSRDVQFELDGKMLNIDTQGRTFEFGVIATDNFALDFSAEIIFIYDQEGQNAANCNL